MNWNVYSRILDEKLGDAEYEFGQAEKKYKATKARVEALRVEKQAFEDSMQVKMDEIDPEFAKDTMGSGHGKKGDTPFFIGYKPTVFFKTTDIKPEKHWLMAQDMDEKGKAETQYFVVTADPLAPTKLTKEDHDAIQLSLFFSGNI